MQQRIRLMKGQKETRRWKCRGKIRNLGADGRCGQAALDSLSSTDAARLAPPLAVTDVASEVSEWVRGERQQREKVTAAEGVELHAMEELRAGRNHCSLPRTPGGQLRSSAMERGISFII
jgi:hypothetical protein